MVVEEEIYCLDWESFAFHPSALIVLVFERYKRATHNWKTSKELEKAIQVYQNAKDRLPSRAVKLDISIERDLAYALKVRECPQVLFLRGNRIVYREREFRKGDEMVQMIAYFYYDPKKPTWTDEAPMCTLLGILYASRQVIPRFILAEDNGNLCKLTQGNMNKAANMAPTSTPKKKFRKHLHNSEHDDNLIDRLSGLSQDLLLRILCLLSLKEALRTCVLSRSWRDLCQFFSGSLNFEASKTLMSDPKKLLKETDGYVEWITQFLDSHRAGTIDELRVCFDLNQQHRRSINRWIDIALMKKVKRLELDFEPCRSNHRRDGQNYLFGWKFSSSSEIRFLTGLCLKHIDVSGQILESFLSNCPLLETLHVSHSKQLTHINVCGSSLRLKHLHISFCNCIKSIEVYAPNLVSFEYRGLERVHIDLKYVPQLCDVSYGGQWESCRVFEVRKSIPSCLATSQLVNLSLHIPYLPFVDISPVQPDFPNLRCLTLEFPNVDLSIQHTAELAKLCYLMQHMPLLHKFKLELEAVEPHIPIEEKHVQSIIKRGRRLRVRPVRKKFMMLREVEIVGFVGAVADSILVCFLSLISPNLDKIVINCRLPSWHRAAPGDEQKIKELEEGKRCVYDMLSAIRPEGSKYVLL